MSIKLNLTKLLSLLFLIVLSPSAFADWQFLNIYNEDRLYIEKTYPSFKNNLSDLMTADKIIKYLYQTKKYEKINVKEGSVIYARPLRKLESYNITGLGGDDLTVFKQSIDITTPILLTDKLHKNLKYQALTQLSSLGFSKAIVSVVPNEDRLDIIIRPGKRNSIQSININTKNIRLKNLLKIVYKPYIKKPLNDFNVNSLKSSISSFLQNERYLDAEATYKINYSNNLINIEISNPYYYRLAFQNEPSVLTPEIRKNLWSKKYSINSGVLSQINSNIISYYKSIGFPFTKISSSESKTKDFVKYHYIKIIEGPRTKVNSVKIKGTFSKKESYYKKIIALSNSRTYNQGFYVEADLESSLKSLISSLNNSGFLFAKIQFLKTYFNKDKSAVDIEISLREGRVTKIADYKFSGLESFKEDTLAKAIAIKRGSTLNLNDISKYLNSIAQFYNSRGFLDFKGLNNSKNLLDYTVDGTEASFNFLYDEGKIAKYGKLILTGNKKSKKYVVTKSLGLIKGEVITKRKIALARKNLNSLSLFSSLNIKLAPDIRNDGLRDIIVTVTERKPGLFRAGLGSEWQDDTNDKITTTLKGFAGASYSNLSGKARAVAGQIEFRSNINQSKILQHKASLGATEPFVFGTGTKGRLNLVSSLDEQRYIQDTDISEIEASNSISLSLEKQINKNLNLLWTFWSLDSISEYSTDGDGNRTNEEKIRIVELGPLLQWDYRDNKFLPTRGSYTRWDTTYAPDALGATAGIQFLKTDFSHSFYYTPRKLLGTSLFTWANSFRTGYIKNLGRLSVPGTRVFRLHGQSKIRGFGGTNPIEQIPSDIQVPPLVTGGEPTDEVDTESYFHMWKSEIRFPLKFLDPFSLAFFYDIGQLVVNDPEKKARFKNPSFRDSVGIGLHLNTPVGPVVLEIAKKIKPLPREKEFRFHFSIGSF